MTTMLQYFITLDFSIWYTTIQQTCDPTIIEATTSAYQAMGVTHVSSHFGGSGGDFTVSMLNISPNGIYHTLFSQFALNYTGSDPNVLEFCHNIRIRDFESAVLCDAGFDGRTGYTTGNSVIPALKDYWCTRGNPFRS